MSETAKPVGIMKTIVGIIALAWAAVMIALYLYISSSTGWSAETADVWALFAGSAALIGAILTWFRKKWAVWLYLAATLAVALTPYMQGSIGPSMGFDWGYIVLLLIYLAAVVPAWKYMGAGNA